MFCNHNFYASFFLKATGTNLIDYMKNLNSKNVLILKEQNLKANSNNATFVTYQIFLGINMFNIHSNNLVHLYIGILGDQEHTYINTCRTALLLKRG